MKVSKDSCFPGKSSQSVRVSTGKDYDTYTDESAKIIIEKYLPEKIREYFFFDGEQLNTYFLSKGSSSIHDAVFAISQVDVVRRIIERLSYSINAMQKSAAAKDPDIEGIVDIKNNAKKELDSASADAEEIGSQISTAKARIQEITEILRGHDDLPGLESHYSDLRKQQKELFDRRKTAVSNLMSFIRESKVALTYYSTAKYTVNLINQKRADKALPPDIDKKMLLQMLTDHRCTICGHDLSTDDEGRISMLLQQIQVSSETSNILTGVYDELVRLIDEAELYPQKRKMFTNELEGIDRSLEKLVGEITSIEVQLGKIGDKEAVRQLFIERNGLEEQLPNNAKKLWITEERVKNAAKKLLEAEASLNKAMSKKVEFQQLKAQIDFSCDCKVIMEKVEHNIMSEVREQMEARTTEYFSDLIWKKHTYNSIRLDEKYNLDLIHVDGYSCVGTCSATERGLLALSFTLALHEISGFDALLFIDTPVARASDVNRRNFANVLCGVSQSKQIIMTFAPDEYSDDIKTVFEPVAKTSRRLTLLDEQIVTVE